MSFKCPTHQLTILPRSLRFRLQFPLQQAAPLCGTGFVGRNQLAFKKRSRGKQLKLEPGPVAGRSDALWCPMNVRCTAQKLLPMKLPKVKHTIQPRCRIAAFGLFPLPAMINFHSTSNRHCHMFHLVRPIFASQIPHKLQKPQIWPSNSPIAQRSSSKCQRADRGPVDQGLKTVIVILRSSRSKLLASPFSIALQFLL